MNTTPPPEDQRTFQFDNPYRSPATTDSSMVSWTGGQPKCRCVDKRLLYRKWVIEAPVECTLEYIGYHLHDLIKLDGRIIVRKLPFMFLTEDFEFSIPTPDHKVAAELHVKFNRFAQIRTIELSLDRQIVYREPTDV